MTRAEIKTYLKAGVDALTPTCQFGRGRASELTSETINADFPYVWQITDEDNAVNTDNVAFTQLPLDQVSILLAIMKKDSMDSKSDEYEQIKDECDEIAQKLLYQLNQVISGQALITLTEISRTPFTKKYAACTTGVYLSFTINSPDKTNNC